MEKKYRGSLFQDNNFQFNAFNGLRLEQLITCEDPNNNDVIIVYIKVKNHPWHQYFLDSGYGFWQNYENIDSTLEENIDTSYIYNDKGIEHRINNKLINNIYCQPEQNNCQIIIEFENQNLILKAVNPKEMDSISELIMQ